MRVRAVEGTRTSTGTPTKGRQQRGFTTPELLVALIVGTIMTVVAIPMFLTALNNARLSNAVSSISSIVSSTRYQALMKSQIYTVVLTVPANSWVVTNVSTSTAGAATPVSNGQTVRINGGTAATFTYTFCPNGTTYGATSGLCPGQAGFTSTNPPALSLTYGSRQVNLAVSTVGNVTTTIIK
jgi:prepilin-type N-terminal cleavage/methylation domain-containing protein